jgi:hypothetical protein
MSQSAPTRFTRFASDEVPAWFVALLADPSVRVSVSGAEVRMELPLGASETQS